MNRTKTQKGITLVALIITIIILLILAVVAIRSITGDGILQKAREASDATARGQAQEELDLAISNLRMEEVIRKNMSQEEKAEWLRNELSKQDGNVTVNINGEGFTGMYKGYNFTITEDYKVIIGEYAQNDSNNSSEDNNGEFDGQLECCGIEGHYIGDNRGTHGIVATNCSSGHQYTCECNIWTVPDGGKYYIGVTTKETGNYAGATKTYNAGEELPCGYVPSVYDVFVFGDYEYRYGLRYLNLSSGWARASAGGQWGVKVLDTSKISYGEILESILNRHITDMTNTFKDCKLLIAAPAIPNNVIEIKDTFNNCTSLIQAPVIPNNIKRIAQTFFDCTSLTQAPIIPNGAEYIYGAFWGCTSLTEAPVIPNTVTDISYTFNECTSLTEAPEIPNSVKKMNSTFQDCTSLTNAPTIPSSVTDMQGTFMGCTYLKTAPVIPSSVTNLSSTFSDCISLTQAPVIPNSVTNMYGTFWDCKSLTGKVEINANPTKYKYCFENLNFRTQEIKLTGTLTMLDTLGGTGRNYCSTCNGACSGSH